MLELAMGGGGVGNGGGWSYLWGGGTELGCFRWRCPWALPIFGVKRFKLLSSVQFCCVIERHTQNWKLYLLLVFVTILFFLLCSKTRYRHLLHVTRQRQHPEHCCYFLKKGWSYCCYFKHKDCYRFFVRKGTNERE